MTYFLHRLTALLRALASPRGALLVLAWLLLLAAFLAGDGRTVLAASGITLLVAANLLASERIIGTERRVDDLREEIGSVARSASGEDERGHRVLVPVAPDEHVGPLLAPTMGASHPLQVVVVVDESGDLDATVASIVAATDSDAEVLLVTPAVRLEAAWTAQLPRRRVSVAPCEGVATPAHALALGRMRRADSNIVVLRAGWTLSGGGLDILRAELAAREPFADGVLSPVRPTEFGAVPSAGAATTGHDVVAVAAGRGGEDITLQRMRTSVASAPASVLAEPALPASWRVADPAVDAALGLAAAVGTSTGDETVPVREWPSRGDVLAGLLELAGADAAGLTAAERERLAGHVRAVVPGPDRRQPRRRDVDVVVVASSAAVVDHLHKWLQPRLGSRRALWLYGDGLDDSQGVAARIEELGLDGAHVAAWTAAGGRARVAVLAFPHTRLSRAVAEAAVGAGAPAWEVPLACDDVLRVDDVTPLEGVRRLDRDEDLPRMTEERWYSLRDTARHWLSDERLLSVEEYPHLVPDTGAITDLRHRHRGQTCVIIGNGPSLNDLDLGLLAGTATFGVNGIFYADDRLPGPLSYYVVEDTMVVKDNLKEIRAYEADTKLFPTLYRDRIGGGSNTHYFTMNQGFYARSSPAFCIPRFSVDAAARVYAGQSVTIMNLQLAYWMGFSEVVLIGMDFSYTVPDDAEVQGNHITSTGDDPNHFHPDYFGKGKVWKDPKLDRVLASYQLAKLMFEADGRRIVNATAGGKLELFDRVDFTEVFAPTTSHPG